DVAGPEPAAVAVLEDGAAADGSRADDVAGQQSSVPRRLREDRLPRVVNVPEVATRPLLAVHACDHLDAEVAEVVGRDDDGAEARREVLPLRRAEADPQLPSLEVAGRPVVHDREAADRALGAHDRGDLELVVELLASLGVR